MNLSVFGLDDEEILSAEPLGCSHPAMARKMISAVSRKGTLTLPTPMHRISVSTVSSANSR